MSAHQPKAGLCMACAKRQHDCSGLPFAAMPPLHTYSDGVTVVKCTSYERPQVKELGPTLTKSDVKETEMTECNQIEAEIQAKGLTAPRITPADIAANIGGEHYFTAADGYAGALSASPEFAALPDDQRMIKPPAPLGLLTFCVLELRNGFTVTGESACASPENFDAEIGRKIARKNAVEKVWSLMGYELKSKLASK